MQLDWTSRRETFGDPASDRSWTFASSMLMRSRTLAGILRRLSVIMKEKARRYCYRIVNVEHGSLAPLIFSTHGNYSQLTSRFIYHLAKLISQKRNICFWESKSWLHSNLSNLGARLTILCVRGSRKIRPPNGEDISIAVSNAQIC